MLLKSYKSPKTEVRESAINGIGRFAIEHINKGEIVVIKSGHIVSAEELKENESIIKYSEMQIADNFYLAPLSEEEFAETMAFLNHSCEPNLGILGNIITIAIRDIEPGEELTVDYAMHISNREYRMVCNCQKRSCRKIITGNDWQKKELQEKYGNYFSSYLLEKIKGGH